jgi:hypothetical protein
VTWSFLIHVFIEPDEGYISRNLVAQQFLIKQSVDCDWFFSEELKYIPTIYAMKCTHVNKQLKEVQAINSNKPITVDSQI